jgi:hypothetical protein
MGRSIVSKVWKHPFQWADVEISSDEITMHSGIQKKKSVICFDIPLNWCNFVDDSNNDENEKNSYLSTRPAAGGMVQR